MKNKFLVIAVSTLIFTHSINLYAAGQKNMNMGTATGNQVEQQTQTANQGEESQIRVRNEEQIQAGTNSESGIKTQTQERTQERLREETGEGNQIQTQNQIQNKGEDTQIRNSEQQQTQTQIQKGQTLAEQRRSQVANAVQEMLKIAERNGGIGQQIRVIAQNQNQHQEKIEAGLQKIQARSGFIKFFIGPNYAEINNVSRILEESQRQIQELNQIRNQLVNQGERQQLTEQIRVLEQAHLQIKNLLQKAQEGFSLFGWAFRLFIK